MDTPEYKPAPLDPAFYDLMATSQQQDIAALQEKVQGDQASILARFGARKAMADAGGSSSMVSASGY